MLGAGLAPAGLGRFRWAGCWRQGVLVKAVKRAGQIALTCSVTQPEPQQPAGLDSEVAGEYAAVRRERVQLRSETVLPG